MDYMQMINARDGGINGVKVTWEKCETEYNNARGVECYERTKKRGPTGATLVHPLSTGITYSLIDKGTADHIPIVSIGYGRTDASDGRVFPWVFPLITNYWSQNTAKIKFIGMKEGGMDKLKGKKIVNIYHDSAYGKETIPVLDAQAKKYGFEVSHIPVAHPGNEQQAQWLQVRQIKPDWVILRGWGVMNPTALKAAAKIGFPRTKIVGVWGSGAEEDVIPAGDAAKGNIDDKKLKQLGATGFMQALRVSCMDHEGGGSVKFLQWDGAKWNTITDWITSDQSIVRPMIEESAAKYAKEKGITPRDCSKEG